MAHVLVIDGEETSRRQLRSVLEQAGHEVSDASDVKTGITKCGTNRPDVLVTDKITPEPEGLDFISDIRKTFSDTRVVAISKDGSYSMGHLLNIARHFGVNRSLCQPIDHDQLLRIVEGLAADGRIELPRKIAC